MKCDMCGQESAVNEIAESEAWLCDKCLEEYLNDLFKEYGEKMELHCDICADILGDPVKIPGRDQFQLLVCEGCFEHMWEFFAAQVREFDATVPEMKFEDEESR